MYNIIYLDSFVAVNDKLLTLKYKFVFVRIRSPPHERALFDEHNAIALQSGHA